MTRFSPGDVIQYEGKAYIVDGSDVWSSKPVWAIPAVLKDLDSFKYIQFLHENSITLVQPAKCDKCGQDLNPDLSYAQCLEVIKSGGGIVDHDGDTWGVTDEYDNGTPTESEYKYYEPFKKVV